MSETEPVLTLGLMSGTSMDGIDACLLRTDGRRAVAPMDGRHRSYDSGFRDRLRAAIGGRLGDGEVKDLERDLTVAHAELVAELLAMAGHAPGDVRVIGFHGHTIDHAPHEGRTVQIGNGALLAKTTGIEVVGDFRSRDVGAGGEGAPLAPIYHAALAGEAPRPLGVLNIGGIANVTWIGPQDDLLAFDTGPGNAAIDDFVAARTGAPFDRDGALAKAGRVAPTRVARLLDHPYFARAAPKSLDRNDFSGWVGEVADLSTEDGVATLTAASVAAIAKAREALPTAPVEWVVTGGGRHNATLMALLAEALAVPVHPVERLGWDGDLLEAQAFAYLAVRCLEGLPISFPGTTGVAAPLTGGTRYRF